MKIKERKQQSAFIICPIGESESEQNERSNLLFITILEPLLKEKKFNIIKRSDIIKEPGNIPSQIITHLIKADLVLADLTDENPNVCYELAIRHCFRKPCVHLIEKNKIDTIPFDLRNERAFEYSCKNSKDIAETQGKIREILDKIDYSSPYTVDNPVANTGDLISLRQIDYEKLVKIVIDVNDQYISLKTDLPNIIEKCLTNIINSMPNDRPVYASDLRNTWSTYKGGSDTINSLNSNRITWDIVSLSAQKCSNCGSYNTEVINDYSTDTCNIFHNSLFQKLRKCNDCGYKVTIPSAY